MISNIIDRINRAYAKMAHRRVFKYMSEMYPDLESRATAFFAMGAEAIETRQFGAGDVVDQLRATMVKDAEDGGWFVEIATYKSEDA